MGGTADPIVQGRSQPHPKALSTLLAIQLLTFNYQPPCPSASPLESALADDPVSVHSTGLAEKLSPLESALRTYKKQGGCTDRAA